MGIIAALLFALWATSAAAEPTILIFPMSHSEIVAKCGPQDDAGCSDISPGHCNIFLNREVANYDGLREHAISACHDAQSDPLTVIQESAPAQTSAPAAPKVKP